MYSLLIDDMRDIDADVVARNFDEGIKALKTEKFDVLFLDHDLASFDKDGKEKTGYDVVCWLEENPDRLPGKIVLVSSNPVGLANMRVVIDKLYNRR